MQWRTPAQPGLQDGEAGLEAREVPHRPFDAGGQRHRAAGRDDRMAAQRPDTESHDARAPCFAFRSRPTLSRHLKQATSASTPNERRNYFQSTEGR
jgi:hypothetical protein